MISKRAAGFSWNLNVGGGGDGGIYSLGSLSAQSRKYVLFVLRMFSMTLRLFLRFRTTEISKEWCMPPCMGLDLLDFAVLMSQYHLRDL